MSKRVEPAFQVSAFNCPHCDVLTTQSWYRPAGRRWTSGSIAVVPVSDTSDADTTRLLETGQPFARGPIPVLRDSLDIHNLMISQCFDCRLASLWIGKKLVHPTSDSFGPEANADLAPEVQADFNEARKIARQSPRGAAALLRLAMQKLLKQLGKPGVNMDGEIGELFAEGMSQKIINALDIVRVVGAEAVHPGQMDLRDDEASVLMLFRLINLIAEDRISTPKHLSDMYQALPADKRKFIEDRNRGAVAKAERESKS